MKIVETVPSAEPWITLADAKKHLREPLSVTEFDTYIEELIGVVQVAALELTNCAILTSTWKYYLDDFASSIQEIWLPRGNVQSVSSIKYINTSGVLTTIDSADYQTDLNSIPATIKPISGGSWPIVQQETYSAIVIEYVAGWPTVDKIPKTLQHAMRMHLAHLYQMDSPTVVGTVVSQVPKAMDSLYASHRVWSF